MTIDRTTSTPGLSPTDVAGPAGAPAVETWERLAVRQPKPARFDHCRVDRRQSNTDARAPCQPGRRASLGGFGPLGQPPWSPLGRVPLGGGTLADEIDFGGIKISTRMRAGWFFGTDQWTEGEFFRARITNATFI